MLLHHLCSARSRTWHRSECLPTLQIYTHLIRKKYSDKPHSRIMIDKWHKFPFNKTEIADYLNCERQLSKCLSWNGIQIKFSTMLSTLPAQDAKNTKHLFGMGGMFCWLGIVWEERGTEGKQFWCFSWNSTACTVNSLNPCFQEQSEFAFCYQSTVCTPQKCWMFCLMFLSTNAALTRFMWEEWRMRLQKVSELFKFLPSKIQCLHNNFCTITSAFCF